MPHPNARDITHWTDEKIQQSVKRVFGVRACYYQLQVARAIYSGKDIIGCAPTGAGKTLSFWIPMLMAKEDGKKRNKSIVISPLNLLAMQTVDLLEKVDIKAVLLTGDTYSSKLLREIESGKYDVIVTNPEILVGNKNVRELFRKPPVAETLQQIILDKGHTIDQWSTFRQHFRNLGDIRYSIPGDIPFHVASAMLPYDMLIGIQEVLNLPKDSTELILYSNDRPDISLMVKPIVNKVNSYHDLDFLIPENFTVESPQPQKFLVFFDNTTETQEAILHLRHRMPTSRAGEIVWFNSTLSSQGRINILEDFKTLKIWGLCCINAFGMGMDVGDIDIVVQYKATTDMCTLWQQFGHAAHALGHYADALLLVEKKDMTIGCTKKLKARQESINPPFNSLTIDNISTPQPGLVPFKKPKTVAIGSPLDTFINLSEDNKVACRRMIPNAYFGNDKRTMSSHRICDPETEQGCQRCKAVSIKICCDQCNPEYFDKYHVEKVSNISNTARRSKVKPDESKVQVACDKLLQALFKWRRDNALKKMKKATIHRLGYQRFMSEQLLHRLVARTSTREIRNVDELMKETQWSNEWTTELGEPLLALLHQHFPPFIPTNPTRSPIPQSVLVPKPDPEVMISKSVKGLCGHKRALPTCTSCHQTGHKKNYPSCPNFKKRCYANDENKENIVSPLKNQLSPTLLVACSPSSSTCVFSSSASQITLHSPSHAVKKELIAPILNCSSTAPLLLSNPYLHLLSANPSGGFNNSLSL